MTNEQTSALPPLFDKIIRFESMVEKNKFMDGLNPAGKAARLQKLNDELLEALELCVARIDKYEGDSSVYACEKAEAVIVKAREQA